MPETIAMKMRSFVNDILGRTDGTGDLVDLGASNDTSVTDSQVESATNGNQSNQGDIKNAKIVLAIEKMLACVNVSDLSELSLSASTSLDTKD